MCKASYLAHVLLEITTKDAYNQTLEVQAYILLKKAAVFLSHLSDGCMTQGCVTEQVTNKKDMTNDKNLRTHPRPSISNCH